MALRLFDFLPATLIEIAVWKVKIYLSFIYLLNYVVVNAGEFGFQSELPFFSSIELNWGGEEMITELSDLIQERLIETNSLQVLKKLNAYAQIFSLC